MTSESTTAGDFPKRMTGREPILGLWSRSRWYHWMFSLSDAWFQQGLQDHERECQQSGSILTIPLFQAAGSLPLNAAKHRQDSTFLHKILLGPRSVASRTAIDLGNMKPITQSTKQDLSGLVTKASLDRKVKKSILTTMICAGSIFYQVASSCCSKDLSRTTALISSWRTK